MARLLDFKVEENEVLLFKNNEPILKVERGTTLDVLKLLYEADPRHSGKVIGLRPLTDERFPCVLTLNHSVLIHSKYEIIAHEQSNCQTTCQGLTTEPNPAETPPQDYASARTRCCSPPVSTHSLQSNWNSADAEGPLVASNQLIEPPEGPVYKLPAGPRAVMTMGPSVSPPGYAAQNIAKPVSLESVCSIRTVPPNLSFSTRPSFILPKKSPTAVNRPVFSSSRRKRNARKSAFARKITLMTPNRQGDTTGRFQVQTLAFSQQQGTRPSHTVETATADGEQVSSDSNQVEICDSNTQKEQVRESPSKNSDEDTSTQTPEVTATSSCCTPVIPVSFERNGERPQTCPTGQVEEHSPAEETHALKNGHETLLEGHPVPTLEMQMDTEGSSIEETEYVQDHLTNGEHAEDSLGESDAYRTAVVRLQDTVQVKTEPNGDEVSSEQVDTRDSVPFRIHEVRGVPDFRNGNSIYKHCCEPVLTSGQPALLPHPSVAAIHTSEGTPIPHLQANNTCVFPDNAQLPAVQSNHTLSDVAHKSDQQEENIHKCNECPKVFETPGSLDRHKRSHSGERPYVCRVCGWGFTTMGNLNQHMAIHQKVKPFKCVYCGKTFARSNVLKAHVRNHTGERPFQCDLCGSKFVIEHNLRKHLLMRHQVEVSSERLITDAP